MFIHHSAPALVQAKQPPRLFSDSNRKISSVLYRHDSMKPMSQPDNLAGHLWLKILSDIGSQ
jgi:hypothetical protein